MARPLHPAALAAAQAFAQGLGEIDLSLEQDAEPQCRHQWNQSEGEADESGARIYCLLCGEDGDA